MGGDGWLLATLGGGGRRWHETKRKQRLSGVSNILVDILLDDDRQTTLEGSQGW